MQGILMWTQIKTIKFLDDCSDIEREQLIKNTAKNRKTIQRKYQEKFKPLEEATWVMRDRQYRKKKSNSLYLPR